jgi:hypothetical protein
VLANRQGALLAGLLVGDGGELPAVNDGLVITEGCASVGFIEQGVERDLDGFLPATAEGWIIGLVIEGRQPC